MRSHGFSVSQVFYLLSQANDFLLITVATLVVELLYITSVLISLYSKTNLLMNSLLERILIILLKLRSKHLRGLLDKQPSMTHAVLAPCPGMLSYLSFLSCIWRINWVNSDMPWQWSYCLVYSSKGVLSRT